jgi:hypothetical protein
VCGWRFFDLSACLTSIQQYEHLGPRNISAILFLNEFELLDLWLLSFDLVTCTAGSFSSLKTSMALTPFVDFGLKCRSLTMPQVPIIPRCGRMVAFQSSELHGVRTLLTVRQRFDLMLWVTSSRQKRRYALAHWHTFDESEGVSHDRAREMIEPFL